MILERIAVSGFRRFANPFELTPDARFTVISAPNGTGKSTLLDAIYYGLLERHTVTGDKADKRFLSLGRDLIPTIEVDFRVGDTQYRLRKTFLRNKSANLKRRESSGYVDFKQSVAADDFVRDLFSAEPGKGAIDPSKHLGLAHVLWAPPRAEFSDLPSSAGADIRSLLGGAAVAVTDGERTIHERIKAEYLKYFTGDGRLAKNADSENIPDREAKIRAAREAVVAAMQEVAQFDRLSVEYNDHEADKERSLQRRASIREQIEQAKLQVTAFNRLTSEAESARQDELNAQKAYDQMMDTIRSTASRRAEIEAHRETQARCAPDLERLSVSEAAMTARINAARIQLEDAGATVAGLQKRNQLVSAAESYNREMQRATQLGATIAAAEHGAEKCRQLSEERASVLAPTAAELEAIRHATSEVEKLRATITASALSLDIVAENALTVDVISGEATGSRTIALGETFSIASDGETVLVHVPGVGRIRARGTDGAATARKKLAPLRSQLEAVRERYGTIDIPQLALLTDRSEQISRELALAEDALSERLSGRTIDDLRSELADANARVASIEKLYPEWQKSYPDATALRAALDRESEFANDRFREAQVEQKAAEEPKAALDAEIAAAKAQARETTIRLEAAVLACEKLEADGLDDAARGKRAGEFAITWDAAKAKRTQSVEQLAKFTDDPGQLLQRLEAEEREAGDIYEEALGRAKRSRAFLDAQASLGTYSKLARLEDELDILESSLASVQAQAEALKRLYETFERISTQRIASVLAPVGLAATQYLTRIVGSPIGTIEIGEGLAPTGLREHTSGERIEMSSTLSTGEKEQIYLAARLALADVITDGRGRQLFVVDDALTATDPNRLRRFVAILEELSKSKLQVIVTTADKSRYLGITGALHIDLASQLAGESAA